MTSQFIEIRLYNEDAEPTVSSATFTIGLATLLALLLSLMLWAVIIAGAWGAYGLASSWFNGGYP